MVEWLQPLRVQLDALSARVTGLEAANSHRATTDEQQRQIDEQRRQIDELKRQLQASGKSTVVKLRGMGGGA
jgi:hypothetical protein